MPIPKRGEVWLVQLDPVRGHEQAGTRPVVVISTDEFNGLPPRLVVAVPITSKHRGVPLHVAMQPPEGGLSIPSWVKCEDLRALSHERFLKRFGLASFSTLEAIESRLRRVLGL
jgi:mRNA interferase MazF